MSTLKDTQDRKQDSPAVEDPYTALKEKLGQETPVGWRWPDKQGNEHDGPLLAGQYMADDFSERHQVDIRVFRTEDGSYRSLFFWTADDPEQEPEYGLVKRWEAAGPESGSTWRCARQSARRSRTPGRSTTTIPWCV